MITASKGYPEYHESGKEISGLELKSDSAKVFHSGTKKLDGKIVTSGGRVLGITGTDAGGSVKRAAELAYGRLERIHYDGMFYRHDIGKRAIDSEKSGGAAS
ncbi:MAG TPA: phosphoribosylglycinamide synthetase C domain-containing protein [Candidatus Kryptobacter bacterium]|nr:phosphoribosylglycinamide synthetase C domain-containing protein [Candidatus Kryptobacter bacterium]